MPKNLFRKLFFSCCN